MKLLVSILSCVLTLISLDAHSVAVTTNRLFLDPKHSSDTVRVLSTESEPQLCQSSIRNTLITPEGNIAIARDAKDGVASKLVRIAPYNFRLIPGQQQNIRVIFRRKPGIEAGEYIGLLSIKCTNDITADQMATVKPNIIHNVPVVIRTSTMPIKANIVSANKVNDVVETTISIEGNRSITGDIQLVKRASGEVIASRKNISVYAQAPEKKIIIRIPDKSASNLLVRFIENKKLDGRVNLSANVI